MENLTSVIRDHGGGGFIRGTGAVSGIFEPKIGPVHPPPNAHAKSASA